MALGNWKMSFLELMGVVDFRDELEIGPEWWISSARFEED
jgi:hypothetical protein